MSFLHLWALGIGIAALAGPVVIHLLTRPRPVRLPLSTFRFVREAVQQRRARHWLRDFIVLALRTLAVAMFALALARPQWGKQPLVSDRESGDAVRVVLLDVSQSMAATVGAVQQVDQAKTRAANYYLRYRPGLSANLILAGAKPRAVFEGPSTNFEALRDELSQCQARPERLDVKAALDRAAQILAPASATDRRDRELVILSDFQRSSWAKADFSVLPGLPGGKKVKIQLESTAPADPPPNLAILRATARAASSRAGSVRLEIEVGNFTPTARKITVEVHLGDSQRRLEGTCPAQGRLPLADEWELHGTGWQTGEARLIDADDALAADNVRPLVVQIRPKPTYALLTREPPGERSSSSHLLEYALVPDGRMKEQASAAVVRVDAAAPDAKTLASADLVCLDHPGKLSDDSIKTLAGLLRRGRPVLYVAGEWIDATNLKRLVDTTGAGLRMPVEFSPPPVGKTRRDLTLAKMRSEETPFIAFGDSLTTVASRLRFGGGLSSRQLPDGLADNILATYNDGSACLVCATSDAGTLAVLNADMGASNLPGSGAFVVLVEELVERMLGGSGHGRAAFCGEHLVAQLPADAPLPAALRIAGPGGTAPEASGGRCGDLVEEGAGVTWRWPSPDHPGAYQVCRDGTPVFAQAIEIDPEESQLESLPKDVMEKRLGAGHEIYFSSAAADTEHRDDLWKWFAVCCVVCILGEITSLLAFRT